MKLEELLKQTKTGRKNVLKKLLLRAAALPKIIEKEDKLPVPGYGDTPLHKQQML